MLFTIPVGSLNLAAAGSRLPVPVSAIIFVRPSPHSLSGAWAIAVNQPDRGLKKPPPVEPGKFRFCGQNRTKADICGQGREFSPRHSRAFPFISAHCWGWAGENLLFRSSMVVRGRLTDTLPRSCRPPNLSGNDMVVQCGRGRQWASVSGRGSDYEAKGIDTATGSVTDPSNSETAMRNREYPSDTILGRDGNPTSGGWPYASEQLLTFPFIMLRTPS